MLHYLTPLHQICAQIQKCIYLVLQVKSVSYYFHPVSATQLGRMCSISLIYSITVGRASISSVSLWVVLALVLFQIDLASSSSLGPY